MKNKLRLMMAVMVVAGACQMTVAQSEGPTDIQLSNASVAENLPVGTFVGEFNATGPNADSTHVFAFAEGEGSQDNNLFTLEADGTLKTNAILDYDANATHTIRVRATQGLGEEEKMLVGMFYLPEGTEGERETAHKKDQWRYVAITKASDLSGSVFVDGKKLYDGTFKNNAYLYVKLYLGASYYTSFTGYFRGMIDEFRLSNKVRTAAEIQAYYQSGAAFSDDGNTIGLWHFDEGSGTTLQNAVGANGNLTGGVDYVPGKFGTALSLDGVNDRGDFNLDMPESNVTFEFWVKGDDLNGTIIQPYGMYSSNIHLSLTGTETVSTGGSFEKTFVVQVDKVTDTSLHTLTVASRNPDSGVAVTVSPADQNGQADGTTQFTRTYPKGTKVTLSVNESLGAKVFKQWLANGVQVSTKPTVTVTMDYDRTFRAVYGADPIGPMFIQGPEFPKRGARGQSAAVVDYNSDGYVDIINGLEVYRNNGNSTFTKVSDVPESPTLSPNGRVSGHGTITAWADFDNDGIRDVLVFGSDFWGSTSSGGHDRLRDRIHKVSLDDQGIPSYGSHHDIKGYDAPFTTSYPSGPMKFDYCQNSTWGVALADINRDGKVDIYLGRGRIGNMDGAHEPEYYGLDWLIQNNLNEGNWNYYDGKNGPKSATLDVTNSVGMKPSNQKVGDSYRWAHKGYRHTEPVCATDYDFDGAPDFFVGNYRVFDNYLWQGKASGESFKFTNTSNQEGIHSSTRIDLDNISGTHHGGGALWFDYDNDGDLDLIEARLSHYNVSSSLRLWRNNGDGKFSNTTNATMPLKPSGFNSQHYKSVTAGDYDNDGDLDLYVTRAGQGGGETAFNRGRLLEYQSKNSKFVDVTTLKGLANRDHFDTFGAAFLDYNNDGNLDLLTTQGWSIAESGKTEIWRNNGNSTGNHLWVNLSAPKKHKSNPLKPATLINPDAIGAIVQLWIDKDNDLNRESGEVLTRQQNGNCTGSMWIGPQPLHFGLGDYDEDDIKWIRILWPGINASDVNAWQYEFSLSAINTTVDLPRMDLPSMLTLNLPTIDSSGRLVLTANGPPNRKVIFQFSNDLMKWNDQLTLPLSDGTTSFNVPIQSSPNAPNLFYRLKLVE